MPPRCGPARLSVLIRTLPFQQMKEERVMRAFAVQLPSGCRYWTVLDDDLRPHPDADAFLQHVRPGPDGAESTTQAYATSIACS